ncbi:MAG TPA: glutamate racemase [Ktedonobacteraceae bacterium]|nr:glutamate racemase [Ktedonobacteraceae bacterium]
MDDWNTQDAVSTRETHPARDAERSQSSLDNERSTLPGKAAAPIGVFDSGAGGLTILAALLQELPDEQYIYFGDTAHCPYGMRSDEDITDLSIQISRFLIERGVKLIIVACNTATQAAIGTLRATFPSTPFIGVVPAVKPAARATKKGRIGIAATNQAARALYLRQLIDEFAEGIQAYAVGCPELVTLVERGELDGPLVEATVQQALQPLLKQDVDVIVLGCTHFPALRDIIERVVGHSIQIIDSGMAIARRTHAVLDAEGLMRARSQNHARPGDVERLEVLCSGDAGAFSDVASKIIGHRIIAQQVDLKREGVL